MIIVDVPEDQNVLETQQIQVNIAFLPFSDN